MLDKLKVEFLSLLFFDVQETFCVQEKHLFYFFFEKLFASIVRARIDQIEYKETSKNRTNNPNNNC